MIIVLKNANFSASNIGTLSTWRITRSIGAGASYSGPISVDKGAACSAVITLAEGYEIGAAGVVVTMGGIALVEGEAYSINGNVITITIAEVIGNVLIKVPTVNTATGEEEPEIPDTPDEPSTAYYYDYTTQGTIRGNCKDGKLIYGSGSYFLTKCLLPSNAIRVEYQAFKTGGSYGSCFTDVNDNVILALPRTDVTTGDRVTADVPEGAEYFYHMWGDPNDAFTAGDPAFTYVRIYTSEEPEFETPDAVYRVTTQNEKNTGLLDAATGIFTPQNYTDNIGQCVTICGIPTDATTVTYPTFVTGRTYGSCFKAPDRSYISGYYTSDPAENGTMKTLTIPEGATEFWFMYPNAAYAEQQGIAAFEYLLFE